MDNLSHLVARPFDADGFVIEEDSPKPVKKPIDELRDLMTEMKADLDIIKKDIEDIKAYTKRGYIFN